MCDRHQGWVAAAAGDGYIPLVKMSRLWLLFLPDSQGYVGSAGAADDEVGSTNIPRINTESCCRIDPPSCHVRQCERSAPRTTHSPEYTDQLTKILKRGCPVSLQLPSVRITSDQGRFALLRRSVGTKLLTIQPCTLQVSGKWVIGHRIEDSARDHLAIDGRSDRDAPERDSVNKVARPIDRIHKPGHPPPPGGATLLAEKRGI